MPLGASFLEFDSTGRFFDMLHSTFQSIEDGENIAARALGRPEIRFEWDAVRAVVTRYDAGQQAELAALMQAYFGRTLSPFRQDFTALVGQAGEQAGGIYEADYRDFNRETYARGRQTFDATYAAFKKLLLAAWRRDELEAAAAGTRQPDPGKGDRLMARRRLTLGDTLDVPRAEHAPASPSPALLALSPTAPIARVAAEAAGAAALQELTETVARARDTGRMVLDLPLDAIAADHLDPRPPPRRGRGDGSPARVDPPPRPAHADRGHPPRPERRGGALPYGLISGWRRLQALKALHAETGEARFATVQALVRRPETAADAYVTMVEENEIRLGLSHYERARVAALATARGVFPSEDDALRALFATASRPKRSRIRAFLDIFHALDGVPALPRPPPRAPRPRPRRAPARRRRPRPHRRRPRRGGPDTPEAELALLTALLASAPKPAPVTETLAPGLALETRLKGRTLTLKLTGDAVTPTLAADLRALLDRLPARG